MLPNSKHNVGGYKGTQHALAQICQGLLEGFSLIRRTCHGQYGSHFGRSSIPESITEGIVSQNYMSVLLLWSSEDALLLTSRHMRVHKVVLVYLKSCITLTSSRNVYLD